MVLGRSAFLLALFCLTLLAVAQDWVPQGSVTSRQYTKQIRGDRGVEATEFFTLEYSVSVQIKGGGTEMTTQMVCNNYCNGKKHKQHSECDTSCDDKCTEAKHEVTLEGQYLPDRGAMGDATRAANGLATRGGGTVSPSDWSHRVSNALAAFRQECKKKKTYTMPHAEACGMRYWGVTREFKSFIVQGTMKKVGYRMAGGTRTEINETVGTHEHIVASGFIPQDEPLVQDHQVHCQCKPPAEPEESIQDLINRLANPNATRTREEQNRLDSYFGGPRGVQFYDSSGKLKFTAEVDMTCTGNDMNTMRLVLTNNSGETVRVVLPPGVRFLPADPAFQIMCTLVRSETMLLSGESRVLYVSVGEPPLYEYLTEEASVRWACMEIQKKEPNSSVKYRPAGNRDNVLTALALITNASRFRGPHDQARMWIYTDKASRDEINSRMIPGVSQGMYGALLRDVAQKAGVDLSKAGFLGLVATDLLSGVSFDEGAVRWLTAFLAKNKTKDLLSFVNGKTASLAELSGKEGKDGPANLAWIVDSLLNEDSIDLQRAAVKVLMAVGVPQRLGVSEAGALEGVRWLFVSGNEELSKLGLDVLEAYSSDNARQLAMASLESMPSDALKLRAAKFAGVEWSSP